MTVPSREEVARAIANERWPALFLASDLVIVERWLNTIARTTVNGQPLRIVIGTTHEGCETCYGDEEIPDPSGCGDPEHCPPFDIPCPDGRPVYWTVKDD